MRASQCVRARACVCVCVCVQLVVVPVICSGVRVSSRGTRMSVSAAARVGRASTLVSADTTDAVRVGGSSTTVGACAASCMAGTREEGDPSAVDREVNLCIHTHTHTLLCCSAFSCLCLQEP